MRIEEYNEKLKQILLLNDNIVAEKKRIATIKAREIQMFVIDGFILTIAIVGIILSYVKIFLLNNTLYY